jgi:predicted anti-sigma-YlaC factor YlaD
MRAICSSVREFLQRRMDDEQLSQQQQHQLDAHLPDCAECRAFESDLMLILGIAKRLPRETAPQALVARVMEQIPAPQHAQATRTSWLQRVGWAWAPLAGVAGVLLLIYYSMAAHGVSLLNLPRALSEWAAMIDLADLGSVVNATSLLSWSVGAEMFLALALLFLGVFGVMAHVMSRRPAMRLTTHR